MEKNIHQIVYISAAEHAFTDAELKELLFKARKNNDSLEISGMLLFHKGSFIQALEGDKDKVNSLYSKIANDKRHSETRVLYREIRKRGILTLGLWAFTGPIKAAQKILKAFIDLCSPGFAIKVTMITVAHEEHYFSLEKVAGIKASTFNVPSYKFLIEKKPA